MRKKSFDEYAILSMAQTRCLGKAYRNLFGWVMRMTGNEATPAEEAPRKAPEPAKSSEKAVPTNYVSQLKEMLFKLGAKNTPAAIAILKKKTGIEVKDFNLTEKHASILLASLLNADSKL
jgi:hypothetical protein